ncbi:MAG: hypothetical protein ABFS17_02620 [Chloroflexota bacterium]
MPKNILSFEGFLKSIIAVLNNSGIEYLIGGAVAVWPWGEPRATQDIDLVINLPAEKCQILSEQLHNIEIYLPPEIILENLLDTRTDLPINAIHRASGFKAEMFPIRPGDQLRQTAFERRKQVDFGGQIGLVYVHSPEDLIIYKLIYFSISHQTKHIRDIGSILQVMGEKLEIRYIKAWVDKKGLQNIWEEIRRALE